VWYNTEVALFSKTHFSTQCSVTAVDPVLKYCSLVLKDKILDVKGRLTKIDQLITPCLTLTIKQRKNKTAVCLRADFMLNGIHAISVSCAEPHMDYCYMQLLV
jgi:hypothetical protein